MTNIFEYLNVFYGKQIVWSPTFYDDLLCIKKGYKVGLFMPNCPQFVISYYALLKIGAVVVNLNPLYTVSELKHMVVEANIRIFITSCSCAPFFTHQSRAAAVWLETQSQDYTLVTGEEADLVGNTVTTSKHGWALPWAKPCK